MTGDALEAKWRGRRGDYGNTNRWLINKDPTGYGWLLHEPITDCGGFAAGAILLPTFEAAVAAFVAFSAVPSTSEEQP